MIVITNADDVYVLNDGVKIPALGYGTWRLKDNENGAQYCEEAIAAGYRHLDTAWVYGSEVSVGDAVKKSGLARDQLFITTKVWNRPLSKSWVRESLTQSLERLRLDYVDLLLVHWPRTNAKDPDWKSRLQEGWHEFERVKEEGLVRSIGVCNFLPAHLQVLSGMTVPSVNQIEVHPGYLQLPAIEASQKAGILVEAWAPLGQNRLINHPTVVEIAERHGVSSAQVLLRFSLQLGILPLAKTTSPERMRQNRDLFGFALTDADMAALRAVPEKTGWSQQDPDLHIPQGKF